MDGEIFPELAGEVVHYGREVGAAGLGWIDVWLVDCWSFEEEERVMDGFGLGVVVGLVD